MSITVHASVDAQENRVEAHTSVASVVTMDADAGEGRSGGPREALLAALAGCTGLDVVSILVKKRQRIGTYEISVRGEIADDHPRVFTTIVVEHRMVGEVTAEALRRSIELSATRYCPVNAMVSAAATVEHRYRLTDGGGAEHAALVAVTGPEGSRVL